MDNFAILLTYSSMWQRVASSVQRPTFSVQHSVLCRVLRTVQMFELFLKSSVLLQRALECPA